MNEKTLEKTFKDVIVGERIYSNNNLRKINFICEAGYKPASTERAIKLTLDNEEIVVGWETDKIKTLETTGIIKVGVGVLIFKEDKLLLLKRKGSHGAGEWGGPGGHLEFGETIEECTKREVLEETGLDVVSIKFIRVQNIREYPPHQYIDIGVRAEIKEFKEIVVEKDKVSEFGFFSLDNLPSPMFKGTDTMLQTLLDKKKGKQAKELYEN